MELIDQLNRAVRYIEDNLTDSESLENVSKVTNYSSYHFQRIFIYLTDMSLSEYIRKRRMSRAVVDLQRGDKVIDVAFKYGYNSTDSFSRAFERQHGCTPSHSRGDGVNFQLYPPLNFHMQIKGAGKMTCRIEKKEVFKMFGVYEHISPDIEKAFEEIPDFCRKCDANGTVEAMNEFLEVDSNTMLHAALYDHSDKGFKYMICQYVPNNKQVPDHFTILYVPQSTWAIFTVDDCEMQKMWKRIYTEWLPSSGYDLVGDINFEMYYGTSDNPKGEIWLPVMPKQIL